MVETAENFCGRYGNTTRGYYDYATMKKEIIAHDAAVAHAARAWVLREVYAQAACAGNGTDEAMRTAREPVFIVAARHGILPAEFEPVKVYGKDDITTDMYHFVVDGDRYRACTKDRAFVWHDKTAEWKSSGEGSGPFFYETTAKAIAAKLRADGNYPKGGGK